GSSYLIYTNMDLTSEDNWLYDTVLYSRRFFADRVSLIMNELQIDTSLRPVVQQYQVFFESKERRQRFKDFEITNYTKEKIELAMMNAICKTRSLDFETVLRAVLMDTLKDDENRYLHDFERFFDENTFWDYEAREYDYQRQEKSLKTLMIHLTVTAFSQTIDEKYLANYQQFIAEHSRTNAIVFINSWMSHKTDYERFNIYIEEIEDEIQLAEVINSLTVDEFQEAEIFPYIEKAIMMYIANNLLDKQEDFNRYIELIQIRRTKHFYERYHNVYEALYETVRMAAFKKRFDYGIPQVSATDMYQAYVNDYYEIDTYYLKLYVAFDAAESNDLLLKLKDLVEQIYTDWFMGELSAHWSQAVHRSEMNKKWTLPGVINQRQFYSSHI